jgi:hypothetical protein
MITCANKECGYKRPVADPEEAVVPVPAGEVASVAV